jgi:hypothetical protein
MTSILGPNTNASANLVGRSLVLCCGEDPEPLPALFSEALAEEPLDHHKYRCYEFWKYPSLTLISAGIGTGCLEPLLVELSNASEAESLALIGTAGQLPGSATELTRAYLVDKAYLAGTAIDQFHDSGALCPKLGSGHTYTGPCASMVSTDLYYGFNLSSLRPESPYCTAAFREQLERHFATTDMVDMESAQFYFLCGHLFAKRPCTYFSVKGPANRIGNAEEQVPHTFETLADCTRVALTILNATRGGGS